jgi:hypothetical protein
MKAVFLGYSARRAQLMLAPRFRIGDMDASRCATTRHLVAVYSIPMLHHLSLLHGAPAAVFGLGCEAGVGLLD